MEASGLELISVGISVYNAENYIKDAVNSVLMQTMSNFELILINDGSDDGSGELLKQLAAADSRIRLIDDHVNKGLISRLNQLVSLSKGKFFVRMDADDIMFPDRLEKQYRLFHENSKVDIVHSSAISIDNENKILGFRGCKNSINTPSVIHPTVFAKRSFFLNNPYQEGFPQMEDMELWHRTYEKYTFRYIAEPLLFYREESSLTSSKHKKMLPGLLQFGKKYNLNIRKIWWSNRLKYLMYILLEKLNLQHVILRHRYSKLNSEESNKFTRILKSIVNR